MTWKVPVAEDRYVSERAWERAILDECPFHPEGGCGVERLGSYPRVTPEGARVARFWCPLAAASISLLPTFLAARYRGTLDAFEATALAVEDAGSIAATVEIVHPSGDENAIGLEGARRSIRRRVRRVRAVLLAVITLMPERFAGATPSVRALRVALATDRVLVTLRALVAEHLGALLCPLGFRARASV